MDYIWIVTFPPVYTGITLTTAAYITVTSTEPTGATLDAILAAGGTIQKVLKLDGGTVTVTDNGTDVPLDGTGTGDLSEDPEHTIDVDQTNGDTSINVEINYNVSTDFVVGNGSTLPLYASVGSGTVEQLSNETGVKAWDAASSAVVNPVCFFASVGGSFFAASRGTGVFYGTWINSSGVTESSFSFSDPSLWYRAIAFDPVTEYFHFFCMHYPDLSTHTHYIYSRSGVLVTSIEISAYPASAMPNSMRWACAYNGDFYFAITANTIKAIYKNNCDSVFYEMPTGYTTDVFLRAAHDGAYIYALVSPPVLSPRLLKISSSGGLAWEYVFTDDFYLDTSYFWNNWLSINNNGDCLVYLYGYTTPTEASFLINSAGSLVWQKNEWLNDIDNDRGYFGAGA